MYRKLLALGAVMAMLVVACGDDDTTDTTSTTQATTTTTVATTTITEEEMMDTELRWRTRPDNDEEAGVYANISDDLDAQLDGITLTYEPGGSEGAGYQQNLLTELSAGTAPDVFWIPGTDVADFVTRGVILDMRSLADEMGHSDSDFYPGPMEHLTYDPDTASSGGKLWGLPRDVSTFALYLNMDLIAEAGAEDPRVLADNGEWNWEKLQEVSDAVATLGDNISGYGQSSWWGPYGYWLEAAGGGFFNDDRTACGLDSPESIQGLEQMANFFGSGSVVPWGEDPEPPFRAGTLGMFQNGRWATPGIRTVDFNWDVVKLPDGPAGPSNWLFWGAYVANADTADPEAAWKLIQALTTAETQAQISELGANIPSRVSQAALDAFLGFTPPENNQAFLDGLSENPTTEGPLWAGSWPDFVSVMDSEVGAVATGDRSIEDFASNICGMTAGAFTG